MHRPIFHCFSELPPEIRCLIWEAALPEIKASLFLYKKGLWQVRERLPNDPDYDCDLPDQNIVHEFRHDLLDPVQVKTALLAVNSEAQSVAIRWARGRNIEIHVPAAGCRSKTVLSTRFVPERDILYVAANDMEAFVCDPLEYMLQDDYLDVLLDQPFPRVHRLSTSVAQWQSDMHNDFTMMLTDPYLGLHELMLIPEDAPLTISRLDQFPEIRHTWTLERWTSLDEQLIKDGALYQQSKAKAMGWWLQAPERPRQLNFYSCHAV